MSEKQAGYGWQSDFPRFIETDKAEIEERLATFLPNPAPEQQTAWRNSITWLQREYAHCVREDPAAHRYSTILEYELPRDFRRPDVIVLEGGTVVVIEVKGRVGISQAALDQVSTYARDLAAYHRACADRPVVPVLVPSNGPTEPRREQGVWVVGPAGVQSLLMQLAEPQPLPQLTVDDFVLADAYAPLPTIVQAARTLFHKEELPRIKRARAATDPALQAVTDIAHEAAATKTRHLVLLSGVPGAGKTLVGLQLVHAGWVDDLSVERADGKPSLPAVYLSGNGPLVQVLQDALRGEESGGGVFVQAIKKYVDYYSKRPNVVPPEHLIVFDEAQRAHDAERVASVHKKPIGDSEPVHLLEFCSRIPEWSVFVALIGSGQAIHQGEEGGIPLWREALAELDTDDKWAVHASEQFAPHFSGSAIETRWTEALNLDQELRFHLTPDIEEFVAGLLEDEPTSRLRQLEDKMFNAGHRFLITRSLDDAKAYMRARYEDAPEARYGLLASSKDKRLSEFGVDNTFQTTKRLKVGPWYNRPPEDSLSCCQLDTVATEFSSQGLELDFVCVAWGSDLLRENQEWSMRLSRGTRGQLRDPMQLRKNVYRVLLTRGRDGTVVYVPDDSLWDETHAFLEEIGFRSFQSDGPV